ncbi:MAG: porin family protein [bacterium]|jgi:hypothetical protein
MKKIILVFLVLFVHHSIFAQGFKLGVKVGANISGMSGLSFKDGFQFGYHGGLVSEIMFSKKIGIQPEFLFSENSLRAGSQFSNIYTQALPNITNIKLKYLTIPILLNYKPVKLISLQMGPQFGILIDQTRSLTNNAGEAFKGRDISILTGVQLNLPIVRLYGRYSLGVTNLNDIDNSDRWKSSVLQMGVVLAL